MSRLGKTLGLVFGVLVLVLAAGITFAVGWHPFIGPRARPLTARKFQTTPERLARGEYLVRNVTDCMGCHAEHVLRRFRSRDSANLVYPISEELSMIRRRAGAAIPRKPILRHSPSGRFLKRTTEEDYRFAPKASRRPSQSFTTNSRLCHGTLPSPRVNSTPWAAYSA